MNALMKALEFYEQFDPTEATKAWREFESLLENGTTRDGSVIIAQNGEKLSLVEEMELAPGKWSEQECETIPFLIVKSGTTPPKQPLTEAEAE